MSSHFKDHLPAFGMGLIVGAGGVLMCERIFDSYRLGKDIRKLESQMAELKGIIDERFRSGTLRRTNSGYYSIHPSSAGEDDEYQDASADASTLWFTTTPEPLLYKDAVEDMPQVSEGLSSDQSPGPVPPEPVTSPQLQAFLQQFDNGFEDGSKYEKLQLLKSKLSEYPENAGILWRLSKLCMSIALIKAEEKLKEQQKAYLYSGVEYGKEALRIDDRDADAHKWLALCLGAVGEFEPMQQKIQNGFVYKEHIEKAIELRPDAPELYHFMGRWCYEIAKLTWLERKAAAALYATPPTASYDEALQYFLRAEEINAKFWNANLLFIAKCLYAKGDYQGALNWLEECLQSEANDSDARKTIEEAESLLPDYKYYA